MTESTEKIKERLKEILGPERGYFGRLHTWEQTPNEYESVGFVPSEDFEPMLSAMTDDQQKNLLMIMTYFEIHAHPLKNLLNAPDSEQLYELYSEIAWSHFATILMFGMLEVAVKGTRGSWLKKKGEKIKKFLEDNLPQDIKDDVVRRYSTEDIFKHPKHKTFGEVIDHLWLNVRGGFVHDVGLEYHTLVGMGTKEEPTTVKSGAPMPEWLQLTWQAILNSYGYEGKLEHHKIER